MVNRFDQFSDADVDNLFSMLNDGKHHYYQWDAAMELHRELHREAYQRYPTKWESPRYREFNIERSSQWREFIFSHQEYDGDEDGRIGMRETVQECVEAIDEMIDEA